MNSEICTQFVNDSFPFAKPAHEFLQPLVKASYQCPTAEKVHADPLGSTSPSTAPQHPPPHRHRPHSCSGREVPPAAQAVLFWQPCSKLLAKELLTKFAPHQQTSYRHPPLAGERGAAPRSTTAPTAGGNAGGGCTADSAGGRIKRRWCGNLDRAAPEQPSGWVAELGPAVGWGSPPAARPPEGRLLWSGLRAPAQRVHLGRGACSSPQHVNLETREQGIHCLEMVSPQLLTWHGRTISYYPSGLRLQTKNAFISLWRPLRLCVLWLLP